MPRTRTHHTAALKSVEPAVNPNQPRVHRVSWFLTQALVVVPFRVEGAGTASLEATVDRSQEERLTPCDVDLYGDNDGLCDVITVTSTGRASVLKTMRALVEQRGAVR